MLLFPDLLVVAALAVLLSSYLIFRFLNRRQSYVSRKNDLLEKFQSLRNRSIKLQQSLSNFILTNHMMKEVFNDDYTYGEYLRYLQKNHSKHLSDKNYGKVKRTNNRILLSKTNMMLEEQDSKMAEAENSLNRII